MTTGTGIYIIMSQATKHIVLYKMHSSYIAAMHDVKGWIIVILVLGNLLSIITDCTAEWKENGYEVFVRL